MARKDSTWRSSARLAMALAMVAAGPGIATADGDPAAAGSAGSATSPPTGRIYFSNAFILPNPDTLGLTPQVYSIAPDGSGLNQLTHVPEGSAAADPSVSPDGRTIAYVSNELGQYDVWLMDSDGSGQRQIIAASPGTDYFTPSWSPDGHRLVASFCDDTLFQPQCAIVTMGTDGTHRHTLQSNHRVSFAPTYSPDGRWIQFSSDRQGYLGAIWVMPAAGGRAWRVTPPRLEAVLGSWSPDGSRIAFNTNCCRADGNVYTVAPDGSHLTQLTHVPFPRGAGAPSYSPDGQWIVLNSDYLHGDDDYNIDLFVMRSDGSQLTRIESTVPFATLTAWGPDPAAALTANRTETRVVPPAHAPFHRTRSGDRASAASASRREGASATGRPDGRIAFRDGPTSTIYTVNPDGSALVQVTRPERDGLAFAATWTPDMRHLVYGAFKDGKGRIYEIGADGTHPRLLVPDRPGYFDFGPSVTPNGRRVFFGRCRPDPPGGCAIATARMDGTGLHLVTPYPSPANGHDRSAPLISPDGRRLAYTEEGRDGITFQIWISHLDGSHAHPVTRPDLEAFSWSWTADGRAVLATKDWAHFGGGIYRIPATGGRPVKLVQRAYPLQDYAASVSPSGRSFAYIHEVYPNQARWLTVANANGSGHRRVPIPFDRITDPVWGSAPLLPASAAAPRPALAPRLTRVEMRELRRQVPRAALDALFPSAGKAPLRWG